MTVSDTQPQRHRHVHLDGLAARQRAAGRRLRLDHAGRTGDRRHADRPVASHDADGDTLTTSYQWTPQRHAIAGATGATLNLATAGNGDRGDPIRVPVSVNDGTVSSAPSTSDPVTIVNSPPVFSTDLGGSQQRHRRRPREPRRRRDRRRRRRVTYSATGLPAGVTIAPATGVISGTLDGTGRDAQRHRDGLRRRARSDTDTFTWTVSPPANAAPVVDSVTITPLLPATGQTLTATVTTLTTPRTAR